MPNLFTMEISWVVWPTIFTEISAEKVAPFSKLLQNIHYFHPSKIMKPTTWTYDVKQSAPTKYTAKFIYYENKLSSLAHDIYRN